MCVRRNVVFSLYCGLMFLLNCLFHSLDGSDYLMINIGMYCLMINDVLITS